MSQDEIAVMKGNKCILQIRGTRPFYSDKYDIFSHSRYKMLSDYNKKYEFDIIDYVERMSKDKIDKKTKYKTMLTTKMIEEAINLSQITVDSQL